MDRKVSWTASDISGSTLDTCPTSLMEGREENTFLPLLRIGFSFISYPWDRASLRRRRRHRCRHRRCCYRSIVGRNRNPLRKKPRRGWPGERRVATKGRSQVVGEGNRGTRTNFVLSFLFFACCCFFPRSSIGQGRSRQYTSWPYFSAHRVPSPRRDRRDRSHDHRAP